VDGEMMAGAWIPASRPMAVRGGTGSQEDLPLTLPMSNDAVYIFLSVQPADEGYRPQGFPITANRLIVVMGYMGAVSEAHHYRYSDSAPSAWPWVGDNAVVDTANGLSELELSVDRDYLDFQVYFHFTTWRNGTGDRTEPFMVSGSTDEDDPFALTLNGSTHWSQTGSSWEPTTALPEGVEYSDIATDDDGTVYILQSNGSVLHADSVEGSWRPFGTGDPRSDGEGFVGIAVSPEDGAVITMRMDGRAFRSSTEADGWHPIAEPPGGHAFADLAAAGGAELFALRNDGAVYTTSGSEGWSLYAPDVLNGPGGGAVGICAETPVSETVVSVIINDGNVHVSDDPDSDWTPLGRIGLPDCTSFIDISSSNGTTSILSNDGSVHVSLDGGWEEYGTGTPSIPASTGYAGLSGYNSGDDIAVAVLRNSGRVYLSDDATDGWHGYGTGTPSAPVLSAYVDIAADPDAVHALASDGTVHTSMNGGETWDLLVDAGDGSSWTSIASAGTNLYVLRNDGVVSRLSTSNGTVDDWGDAGGDTSWTSIATDGSFVYALRNDGVAAVRPVLGSSWSAKGDAGDGTSWVSIGTSTASPYVYAMDNTRMVSRATGGSNSTWTDWAPSGTGTAWISIAVGEYYVFALNMDGTIDRALMTTSEWNTSYGDIDAAAMTGMDAVVFAQGDDIPEFGLLVPLGTVVAIFMIRRKERL